MEPFTLQDCDEAQDDSALNYLVTDACTNLCLSIEFHDDNYKLNAKRTLEYAVTTLVYNGYVDEDEDGKRQDTSTVREIVSVNVSPEMRLTMIAELVADEVRAIDSNYFNSKHHEKTSKRDREISGTY